MPPKNYITQAGTPYAIGGVKAQRITALDMVIEMAVMTAGKKAVNTMHLFSNTNGADIVYDHYDANTSLWCQSLRSQLTGVHMGMSGGWGQSYAFQPVTEHHLLSCAHNGDSRVGKVVTWIHPDGATVQDMIDADDAKVCKRTINSQINDYPNAACSDTKQTYEADLMICGIAGADLPDWVCTPEILVTTAAQRATMGAAGLPAIVVSQGNPGVQYTGEFQTCPHNRKAYLAALSGYSKAAQFAAFRHDVTTGDSGTNQYLLIDGTIYLHACGGVLLCDRLAYLNSLIARSVAVTGGASATVATHTFNLF